MWKVVRCSVKGYEFKTKEMSSTQRNFFLSKDIICCQRKLFPVKINNFLWKEMISCERKWFPGKWNDFLNRNDSLSKEIIFCQFENFKGDVFLSKEIIFCQWINFLSNEIIYCERKWTWSNQIKSKANTLLSTFIIERKGNF